MASRIVRIFLILAAVILPYIIARAAIGRRFSFWFEKRENAYFAFGVPVTREGYMVSLAVIAATISLLILVNSYA